jgi:DNA-binding PadR family transcriptional regulator
MRGFHHKFRGARMGECDSRGEDFARAASFAWRAIGRGGGFAEGFGFGGGHGRGGFGGGGGFGGPGRGRRRLFDADQLQLLLLALIAESPRHGYDLIKEIEARSGGVYAPSPGVVYPTLTMLDEMGFVDEVKEEGARRRFAISDSGKAHLAGKQEEADALLARLAALDADRARTDRAPIRRAMMSLGMAVREAVSSQGENDRAHDIAAILDEAARKIERL